MIDLIEQTRGARHSNRLFGWIHQKMPQILLRHRIIGAAVIVSLLAALYWLVVASNIYVSEAHVIIERTELGGGQLSSSNNIASMLGGGDNDRADQLLLRDHLLSVDMLKKLDKALNLRAHYSDPRRDFISRMWFQDASIEWFYRHYLEEVSVEYDDYEGVLIVKAEAYDPKTAFAITTLLVQEGERLMNDLAHSLAQDQVAFLEQQVEKMYERVIKARLAIVNYQNKKGLVSPQTTAENMLALIGTLEGQHAGLEMQRSSLQAYLVPNHPNIVMLDQQISAVEKQIVEEKAKLTSINGKTLNRTVEEYQRLEMEAGFAQDVYKTALEALERGRLEASRTIKKVSMLQEPTQPEYPLEPRRLYSTLVSVLIAMLLAGVAQLLTAIVRDHKD